MDGIAGMCPVMLQKVRAGLKPALTANAQLLLLLFYAFPASFNPRSTFSGLSGSLWMRTPVALKIALAMQTVAGTQGDFLCAFGSPVTVISTHKGSAT